MREQSEYLRDQSRLPHVEALVLPWGAGAHPCMTGPFVILGFDGPDDPDVLYLETVSGARYIEEAGSVREYLRRFEETRRQSVSIEEYLS